MDWQTTILEGLIDWSMITMPLARIVWNITAFISKVPISAVAKLNSQAASFEIPVIFATHSFDKLILIPSHCVFRVSDVFELDKGKVVLPAVVLKLDFLELPVLAKQGTQILLLDLNTMEPEACNDNQRWLHLKRGCQRKALNSSQSCVPTSA